jgi:hypothetical protein
VTLALALSLRCAASLRLAVKSNQDSAVYDRKEGSQIKIGSGLRFAILRSHNIHSAAHWEFPNSSRRTAFNDNGEAADSSQMFMASESVPGATG